MNEATLSADRLAVLVPAEVQRMAARMAQDAFSRLFRLTLEGDEAFIHAAVAELERLSRNWAQAGGEPQARALRLALLVTGLDQWGLAYARAFDLVAIPALSNLIGRLRAALDAAEDARFQQQFAAVDAVESDAIDFKMELRRAIHLALWHALIASQEADETQRILLALGGLLVALDTQMPVLGWRLVADTLAHIQIRCLSDSAAVSDSGMAATQELFAALRQALPAEDHDRILAHASQATIAWQQARRATEREAS